VRGQKCTQQVPEQRQEKFNNAWYGGKIGLKENSPCEEKKKDVTNFDKLKRLPIVKRKKRKSNSWGLTHAAFSASI